MDEKDVYKRFNILSEPAVKLAKEQKFRRAINLLEKLIATENDRQIYYLAQIDIGACLEGLGKDKEAIERYESIPESEFELYTHAQFRLAGLLIRLRKMDEVQAIYDKLSSYTPLTADMKNSLGYLLDKLNKTEEAIQLLNSITRSDGLEIYVTAKTNQAMLLGKLKRYDEILPICYSITKDADSELYGKARLLLGDALDNLGRKEESFNVFNSISKEDEESYRQARFELFTRFPLKTIKQCISNLFAR